jgi:hypothetical protein
MARKLTDIPDRMPDSSAAEMSKGADAGRLRRAVRSGPRSRHRGWPSSAGGGAREDALAQIRPDPLDGGASYRGPGVAPPPGTPPACGDGNAEARVPVLVQGNAQLEHRERYARSYPRFGPSRAARGAQGVRWACAFRRCRLPGDAGKAGCRPPDAPDRHARRCGLRRGGSRSSLRGLRQPSGERGRGRCQRGLPGGAADRGGRRMPGLPCRRGRPPLHPGRRSRRPGRRRPGLRLRSTGRDVVLHAGDDDHRQPDRPARHLPVRRPLAIGQRLRAAAPPACADGAPGAAVGGRSILQATDRSRGRRSRRGGGRSSSRTPRRRSAPPPPATQRARW